MLARCSRAAASHFFHQLRNNNNSKDAAFKFISHQSYAKAATAAAMAASPILSSQKVFPSNSVVNLDKMFRSKPCSLALAPDSPLRIEEPEYEGIRRFVLKLLLFYSKQSKSIRGANVVYRRIVSQVDRPAIYEVFNLEKTFKMTFSLLVLHMWLCLRRLKQEGKEGVEFGQYIYEIYNHDVELRVSKAGVNLLLTKWMKELEKILYGNIVAYDAAMLPEAKPDELPKVIWRNVFSDDGTTEPDDTASQAIQAMARQRSNVFWEFHVHLLGEPVISCKKIKWKRSGKSCWRFWCYKKFLWKETKDVFRASQALHGRSYEAMLKLIISSPLSLIFVTREKF